MNIDSTKLTRVTVVDHTGRILERWGQVIELSVQDDGRTLKVFLRIPEPTEKET